MYVAAHLSSGSQLACWVLLPFLGAARQSHLCPVRSERMMKIERRRRGSVIVQVLERTASVRPGRHGAGSDPPRSIRRPFRLEKPFMPSLQRIPVKPAVNKGEDRFQILPEGQRGDARKRLVGTLTCIEARHLKFTPGAPLPVENGEMTLAVILYRVRNKPWPALRFLECGRKQAFKALELRASVGLLQHRESCDGYAGRPFPLLSVPGVGQP